jgi:hypothetical protein
LCAAQILLGIQVCRRKKLPLGVPQAKKGLEPLDYINYNNTVIVSFLFIEMASEDLEMITIVSGNKF